MRLLLIAVLFCAPLPAQLLNWGVKGGVPFNDAIKAAGSFNSNFSRWTVGPVVELNLPAGLGVEFNALYRRTGYSTSSVYNSGSIEFPLLVKYKFPGTLARMYVDGGFVFRRIGDIPLLQDANSKGLVFGVGFRYDLGLVKVSPEIRYTRWDNEPFRLPNLTSARNQTEFLVGITF
jgi:Outer membrane protein beta-barrel domain